MTQDDWPTRLGRRMATEVKRYRRARGLSAQQLSDRCAEIGMPIARSVLANFESGRRPSLSVAELLVVAEALRVPPTSLVFPVGYERAVEALPNVELDTFRAAHWWGGVGGWAGISTPEEAPTRVGLVLFDEHADMLRDVEAQRVQSRMHLERAAKLDKDQHAELRATLFDLSRAADDQAGEAEAVLLEIRSAIRERGMQPPALPDDLTELRRLDAAMSSAETTSAPETSEEAEA